MNVRKLAEMLRHMDEQFDGRWNEMIDTMIDEFGDEANDIGDAGNVLELIANTCLHSHDSYTCWQAREFVSKYFSIRPERLTDICNSISKLNTRQYTHLHAMVNR